MESQTDLKTNLLLERARLLENKVSLQNLFPDLEEMCLKIPRIPNQLTLHNLQQRQLQRTPTSQLLALGFSVSPKSQNWRQSHRKTRNLMLLQQTLNQKRKKTPQTW